MTRTRPDRCPGALRPWAADDGLLVRLRLIGGRVSASQLLALAALAEEYGDGRVHLTGRANLQVRGLPADDAAPDRLRADVLAAVEATGLLPSRTHELVRNILVSPQTGRAGGRADLRPVAAELDRLLCAEDRLAVLSGRFLFVLDDGRGDLVDRPGDLGLVALGADAGQLRVGAGWGPVVPLAEAAARLAALAVAFTQRRGEGLAAPWHVAELFGPLTPPLPPDPAVPDPIGPLPYGDVAGGRHVCAPDGLLDRAAVDLLAAASPDLVVTPWRGVLVPQPASQEAR